MDIPCDGEDLQCDILPLSSVMMLSDMLIAAFISCSTIIIAIPDLSLISRRRFRSPAFSEASRDEIGSSARRISGFAASALAIATRCLSPPESSEGLFPSRFFPSWTSSMYGEMSSLVASLMIFSIVILGSRDWYGDWNTSCIERLAFLDSNPFSARKSEPLSIMRPESGGRKPASILSSVDFPDPDSPIIASISPLWMDREMSERTSVPLKLLLMCSACNIASMSSILWTAGVACYIFSVCDCFLA